MDIRTQLGKKWNKSQFLNNSNSLTMEKGIFQSEIRDKLESGKETNTRLKEFGFRYENNWTYLHVTDKQL